MALLSSVIQSGTRAAQPAATAVAAGVLYFVTDEGELERSTGAAWVQVAVNETGHDTLDHTGLTGVGGASLPAPWALVPDTGAVEHATINLGANNRGVIVPAFLLAAATITGVRVRIGASSGNVSVALYDSALARLATSGAVASPGTGGQTIAFTAGYAAAAGRYYIGLSASTTACTFAMVDNAPSGGSPITSKYQETAQPLPDPFVPAGISAIVPAMIGVISGGWAP